jgi:hypothetical protein
MTKQAIVASKPAVISGGVIATAIIAGLLLVIANSAVWINQAIFNSDTFSDVTTKSLLSESSRRALAGEVVDKALATKPIIKSVVGGTATNMIAGLLASNQAQGALDKAVSGMQIFVTSKNPRNIEFDIAGIKSVISRLLGIIGNEDASSSVSDLPDTLVVVDASKVPNIYNIVVVFLWLAPLALIAAFILLAVPHFRRKAVVTKVAVFQGAVVVGSSLLALSIGPLFRPALLAQIADPHYRVVAQNLYDSFTATFSMQTLWLFAFGLLVALVPTAVKLIRLIVGRIPKRSTT